MVPGIGPEDLNAYLRATGTTARALSRQLGANPGTVSRWLLPRDNPQSRRPTGLYARELRRLLDRRDDAALIAELLGPARAPEARTPFNVAYQAGAYLALRDAVAQLVVAAREQLAAISATLAAQDAPSTGDACPPQ